MKKLFKWCFFRIFPALALLIYIGFAWYSSKITISPPRRAFQNYHREILRNPAEYGLSCTAQRTSSDMPYLLCEPHAEGSAKKSRELRAAMVSRQVPLRPWGQVQANIIALHSHKGRKEDLLPICERFCAAGFRCLCPDLPGHGENPLPSMHFGAQEIPLLREMWLQHLEKFPHHAAPLFFFGYSQGGVLSLQAAADTTAWQASAVVSVNAFATLDCPIRSSAAYLPRWLHPISGLPTSSCALGIRCRVGAWPSQIGPLAHVPSITCPTMIIHGENDRFVPPSQAHALFNALSPIPKKLTIIPQASHQNTLATGSTPLYADICAWFLAALPNPA